MILRLGLAAALSLMMWGCSGDEEKAQEPVAAEGGDAAKMPDAPGAGETAEKPAGEGAADQAATNPMDAAKEAAEKAKAAAETPAPAPAATAGGESMVVKAGALNVRAGMGTKHKVVRTLKKGETVAVAECTKGWCKVGDNEYVSKKYLSKAK